MRWRVGLLSSLISSSSSSKTSVVNQGAHRRNLFEVFSTEVMELIGMGPNIVLFFDCPEDEMVRRVLSRNQGRVDDNVETVKKRLKVFAALNLPVIKYYSERGKLHKIDGVGTTDEIFERVRPVFALYETLSHHPTWRSSPIPPHFLPTFFPASSFLVGFSSLFWREAWKYGERAFRYCNHDVGHAIAALVVAAAALGWDVKILDGLGFSDLEKLMGMTGSSDFAIPPRPVKGWMPEIEFDHPDCVLLVFPSGGEGFDVDYGSLSSAIGEVFDKVEWVGEPNLLSKEHVCWDIIYRTAEAVKKPLTASDRFKVDPFVSSGLISENVYKGVSASEVIRKRRSAVDMDGVHVMERDTFYQILMHCLPSGVESGGGGKQGKQLALPFRVLTWEAEVHAVLFVHRVAGLPMGLYFLVRNDDHFDELKRSTRSEFEWERPEGCPHNLPLYRLAKGDLKLLSKRVSCHQDIASDGCFSLGMVARFEQTLQQNVWMYPRLFWETGVLGQVLYLEAHAVGISATGIGCYFDDAVHEILGLSGSKFQSLYHFTVGAPVIDKRIMSLPAYPGPDIDT
ncbi:hypothetical protein Sjap_020486 [Stephania japonica]|uniref:adenylate kinase n=1 Tax=Stephania japonica TaxID=461633 RepID=A0AAP0F6B2_9MAGN